MIIVLDKADFSAKNIGKINIPVDYDDMTKAIFSKCTRFELGSAQSNVVNTFVKSMRSAGILEHLSVMFLPWLSTSNAEAFYNFADGVSIEGKYYSGGFQTTQDGKQNPLNDGDLAILNTKIPTKNFFCLIREEYPSATWTSNPYFRGSGGITIATSTPTGSWISTAANTNAGSGYGTQDDDLLSVLVEIGSYANLEQDPKTLINGKRVVVTSGFTHSGEPFNQNISWYAPYFASYKDGQARVIAMAGDGTELTSVQRNTLISAMKALRSGLAELEAN